MSKAGPSLLRATVFRAADTARRQDHRVRGADVIDSSEGLIWPPGQGYSIRQNVILNCIFTIVSVRWAKAALLAARIAAAMIT
jgi:hypothetical protein